MTPTSPVLQRLEVLRAFKRRMPRADPAENVSPFDDRVTTAQGDVTSYDLGGIHADVRQRIEQVIRAVPFRRPPAAGAGAGGRVPGGGPAPEEPRRVAGVPGPPAGPAGRPAGRAAAGALARGGAAAGRGPRPDRVRAARLRPVRRLR